MWAQTNNILLRETQNPNQPRSIAKLDDWDYEEPKKIGDIVLQPQPTDSPNDPLNWSVTYATPFTYQNANFHRSTGMKISILLIVSLTAGVTVS